MERYRKGCGLSINSSQTGTVNLVAVVFAALGWQVQKQCCSVIEQLQAALFVVFILVLMRGSVLKL